jgi:hypothetical protein
MLERRQGVNECDSELLVIAQYNLHIQEIV